MAITLSIACVLIFGLCRQTSCEDLDLARPIQIVTPVNHTFRLEVENLKQILEMDNIKDHQVVVVSIAGAFRKGKSFLLNFFIRYLNAQVPNSTASVNIPSD